MRLSEYPTRTLAKIAGVDSSNSVGLAAWPEIPTEQDIIDLIEQYCTGGGGGEQVIPVGSCVVWFTGSAPDAWLICDGQAVSRSVYADLFALIGVAFGTGDGLTTFNLPDMRGRFALGSSTTYGLQSSGGESDVTLTINQIPSHGSHNAASGTRDHRQNPGDGGLVNLGGGLSHNNMPPYLSINFIIYAGV